MNKTPRPGQHWLGVIVRGASLSAALHPPMVPSQGAGATGLGDLA